jgi:hypothetical protein
MPLRGGSYQFGANLLRAMSREDFNNKSHANDLRFARSMDWRINHSD